MTSPASDARAPRFPVSVKGVVLLDDDVLLLKNARDEWELPGGKLEPGESPEGTVTREIQEELALDVRPVALLDTWVYPVRGVEVLIVTYGCRVIGGSPTLSDEHRELGRFAWNATAALPMPDGYKQSIAAWGHRERRVLYKIVAREEWRQALDAGAYAGSADDRRDGFIHLSAAAQVAGTLAKHFAGRDDLLLVAVEAAHLDATRFRWEPSRGGARFPHLYGALPMGACTATWPLRGGVLPPGV